MASKHCTHLKCHKRGTLAPQFTYRAEDGAVLHLDLVRSWRMCRAHGDKFIAEGMDDRVPEGDAWDLLSNHFVLEGHPPPDRAKTLLVLIPLGDG